MKKSKQTTVISSLASKQCNVIGILTILNIHTRRTYTFRIDKTSKKGLS